MKISNGLSLALILLLLIIGLENIFRLICWAAIIYLFCMGIGLIFTTYKNKIKDKPEKK